MKKQKGFTRASLDRIWSWGQFMVHDERFKWTETDTRTLGIIAYEIKRFNQAEYQLRKQVVVKKKFIEKFYDKKTITRANR